jgi:Uma2 family endonuclease
MSDAMTHAAPKAILRPHRVTIGDYHRMAEVGIFSAQDRVELIEGAIIDMAPIGPGHADVVDRLAARLIKGLPTGLLVRVQNPLTFGDASEPQPDIAVVTDRSYAQRHPGAEDARWIIEVSDTTLAYDREVTLGLYARSGVPEVWIVNLAEGQLEVYREPTGGRYSETIRPARDEQVSPLVAVGSGVTFAEIVGER